MLEFDPIFAAAEQSRASPAILASITGPLLFPSTDNHWQSTTEAPAHHQVMTCKKNKWSIVDLNKIEYLPASTVPG